MEEKKKDAGKAAPPARSAATRPAGAAPRGTPAGAARPAARRWQDPNIIRVGPGPGHRRRKTAKRVFLALAGLAAVVLVTIAVFRETAYFFRVRQGGLNLMPIEDEWQLGAQLHTEITAELPLLEDAEATAFVQQLGESLVAHTPYADRPWRFHVLHHPMVNAFNIPGGHVYVTTGLIEESDTLDMFAGVVSHEVAHGAARHGTQILTRSYGLGALISRSTGGRGGPPPAEIARTLMVLNYDREAEREADALGTRYMFRAGYDPRGIVHFFEKIQKAEGEDRSSPVLGFLSTHPMTKDRIEDVQGIIDNTVTANVLRHDTPEYRKFRAPWVARSEE